MTKTNRTILATLALSAVVSTSALSADTQQVNAIAPGGNIRAVEAATADKGWPHVPTDWERVDIARLVLYTTVPRNRRASDLCRFGVNMGRVRCTVTIGRKQATYTVRIWEDGSYRIRLAPR